MYAGVERRKYKRIRKNFMARFQIQDGGGDDAWSEDWNMVTMRNLGAGGGLFNYNRKLKTDSLLHLKINFPLTREPIDCVGKVTRVEDTMRSIIFRIAVAFMEVSDRQKRVLNESAEELYSRKPEQIEF